MSEMDPLLGTGGAPGEPPSAETAPVEASPVETSPVTAPPAAAGGPPAGRARPAGLLRWGVALAVVAVTVGVVSVAAAMLTAGGGTSAVQRWLPENTVAYLEIRADLPGDQRAKVGDLLSKFPGFRDQASLDAKIDEALDKILESSGVSWSADLKPWVGGEVGIALTSAGLDLMASAGSGGTPAAMPDDGVVALVAIKDGAAAKAWLTKELGGSQTTETYGGGDLIVVEPSGSKGAFAIRGNVLLLGPVKAVKAALDTNGASPLPAAESFAAARKTAPDAYLGFGYFDGKAFVGALAAAVRSQGGTAAACLEQPLSAVPTWIAGSARAEDAALVLTATSVAPAPATTVKASASGIASHLPGTTLGAVEIRAFGSSLATGFDALKEQLTCDPALTDTVDQLDQALTAVGGIDALLGWAGDTALAVDYEGGTFGGGLAAIVDDEAAASTFLTQLQTGLALAGASAGISSRTESYGDGTLLVVTIPSEGTGMAVPEIAATVQKGVFVLGTIDFVKHVVDTAAGSSLASSEAYTSAIALAGGDGVSDVFVDIAGIRSAIEAMLPADQKARYETDVKPFIEPFKAFASVTGAPGATSVGRVVITFTK